MGRWLFTSVCVLCVSYITLQFVLFFPAVARDAATASLAYAVTHRLILHSHESGDVQLWDKTRSTLRFFFFLESRVKRRFEL